VSDRDVLFHERWLGLVQPIEGLVFSVPVLADAQIAPELRAELSVAFAAEVTDERLRDLPGFLRRFLGYAQPGMLLARDELPTTLSYYAAEGGQELRPSWAIMAGDFALEDDALAQLDAPAAPARPGPHRPEVLIWDLAETAPDLDLDAPEDRTGPWRYPPSAKWERVLRHTGVPIGLVSNGAALRLLYAPAGETTGHLTFRVEHLLRPEGRPILAALELLLGAKRAYGAAPEHTLGGLLAESRRRQADVTDALAEQVFEAVELLLAGFEAAAARDTQGAEDDWLRAALEAEDDHFYQGILSLVLRLVFLLYSEDQSLLPVEHPTFARHLSVGALHARLTDDASAHPESMHHRFGAYGQLLALFRAVYFGVQHGALVLPPRRGRLFDPNTYPFLEGGLPGWTAAVVDPVARAQARPPSLDDGTIHDVLQRLVVFQGQRLSYRTLDVEQIGSVYESLMGYEVRRLTSPAVRLGPHGVWVEVAELRAWTKSERAKRLKEGCGLGPGPVAGIEAAVVAAGADDRALFEAISAFATGRRSRREAGREANRAEAGRLVLQPGEERRRTGSHYTPRALTEKVVRRTLEPLLACLGPERTAAQILQLKICDPAMGSGAFLVATCRELASELVAAWTRSGELAAMIEAHGDAHLHARRLVAQQCLYGVDKNAAAVELAKLSLWLITLSRQLPFTFVDHALRHGDSLVGLDFKQLEAFHWKPPAQVETVRLLLREALDEAVTLRREIQALSVTEDAEAQAEKRRLFEFSQQAIERVRVVADVCVGAFFAEAKDAAREKERKRRLGLVEAWLGSGDGEAEAELIELAEGVRRTLAPFHWWIEFPEVFIEARPDPLQGGAVTGAAMMEGVVGNPPFGGKNTITDASAAYYLDWLMAMRPEVKGRPNTDLSAYFFRRAADLIGANGAMGLIATNTIAQGDSRLISLKKLIDSGVALYSAETNVPWSSASVIACTVNLAFGCTQQWATPRLDDVAVAAIDSRLRARPEREEAVQLNANDQLAFMGGKLVGAGLAMTMDEFTSYVTACPQNGKALRPYLGGEEVNSSPRATFQRYMIDFTSRSLEEASAFPELMARIEERVKPTRMSDKRSTYRTYWWRPGESGAALYSALAGKARCIVAANVSKHLMFTLQPTSIFFSQTLYVFALDSYTAFSTLQSRVHEPWARLLSSSLEDRLRYAASDCFETFPFPQPDPRTVLPDLEAIGERLYTTRAQLMLDTDQGLTKTYNALKDPSCTLPRILELRGLHEDLDRAVLAAYGWSDLTVPPFCPLTDDDQAQLQAFQDEVVDRLYVLNATRAAEEQRLGLTPTTRKTARAEAEDDA
jgi:hypothetical protein